ncbi:hypothetical protein PVAP13_3KG220427 [Panicum virgatum]|uniref:Uncharacterized protein n=1 Tax=Panicum virgatum TaxID=38727 RepID=A0A8T0URR4_PANVG|nr:hypothetical protein PVAP13_3KG220427 [Panicum virgatum]
MKCHRPSAPRLERPHPLEPPLFLSRFLPSPSPRLLRPAPLPVPARVSTAGDEELEDPIAPPLRGESHSMDLQEHHDLIFGEEFCFPTTTTYYPALYAPTGINVPPQFYHHQTMSRCDNRAPNYMGHQAQGTSCMYYVVPEYGIAHSPHEPDPLHPCAIGDGRFVRTQEYRAETVEHTYYQPVPVPHYAALPSAADRTPATTAQSLAYANGLFVPCGHKQTVAVTSERGVAWNQSVQQATTSSMEFQGHTLLPSGAVGFAAGGRAWATGSRAARDGTAARKKRERARFGRRKKERKRWNNDWDGENFLVRVK